jgi:hypothetical protein
VEFASIEEATQAAQRITDTTLKGRKIFAREDREEKGFGRSTAPGGAGQLVSM